MDQTGAEGIRTLQEAPKTLGFCRRDMAGPGPFEYVCPSEGQSFIKRMAKHNPAPPARGGVTGR